MAESSEDYAGLFSAVSLAEHANTLLVLAHLMVRTRFAPSPTGYLHIGGVRTALFNWLFARRHGGQFLLRIDDTDAGRNVEAALAPILHGFRWLGLDWDEGPEVGGPHAPYFQSQRLARYQAAAKLLVERGCAYWDYARPEELQAERDEAMAEKRNFVYSRRWLAETDAQRAKWEQEGRQGVIRLKMPREGTLIIDDAVRGRVEFAWAAEADHVVQRADGTCLYHLASVVDDHDFEITHVIRAEEHLSNTPRQIFIAQSLGYPLPNYAHLPYVAEPGSKNKLSKRKLDKYLKNKDFAGVNEHGVGIARALGLPISSETFNPVIVDFYEQVGYLPEAIVNYLLLLGWSFDDRTEFFTRSEMIERFTLDRVNKAPASFDPRKLLSFQDHYFQATPIKQKVALLLPYLQKANIVSAPPPCDVAPLLTRVAQAAGDRLKVAGDILQHAHFFQSDEALEFDGQAFDQRLRHPAEAVALLTAFAVALNECRPFEPQPLEQLLSRFVAAHGIQNHQIIHAVRIAVTGKPVGFGLFDTLAILGPERCQRRIERALARI